MSGAANRGPGLVHGGLNGGSEVGHAPTSVDTLAAVVREHASARQPMRWVGSGTWLRGGGPFIDAPHVSLRGLSGVVEYTPGDLVITVGAGTTMAELSTIAAAKGQTLAIRPYGDPQSTIGAIVATAAPSPLALDNLEVRDLVLGLTVVSGHADITRVGGRVVKNVAGFDLVRLHTGAWGTLGVIAEVSLRLHAIPRHDELLSGALPAELGDALPPLVANRAPIPMLVVLEPGQRARVLARVTGNTARVEALRARLLQLGMQAPAVLLPHEHDALRATGPSAMVLRLRTALSDAVPFVRAARDAFPSATLTYAPHRGSLRVVIPTEGDHGPGADLTISLATMTRLATSFGAAHPMSIAIDQGRRQHPALTPLAGGIKRALDPDDLCNRLAAVAAVPTPLPA